MNLIEDTLKVIQYRYSELASEIADAKFEYRTDLKYKTAATDGKDVFLDPDYFASLDEEERAFLLAHELMHKKFLHTIRLEKNGVKKDLEVWNEATDAIINANLERDGFKIKKGYINRPEALHYSADEFYEILLKEKELGEKKKSYTMCDDHTLWEEAPKEENEEKIKKFPNIDEREDFAKHRKIRIEKAKANYEQLKEGLRKQLTKEESKSEKIELRDIGKENTSIDWKDLLRKEVEKEESIWSQRRSIFENNYAYRLEEYEELEDAETEVQIDVSGSVDLELVKSFLRIIKSIFVHSKLKVGCFNTKFFGWIEIKKIEEIENFIIPEGARGAAANGTDLDLAARSFTKEREINKIVFTDGYPSAGCMPKEDLKNTNVLWLVYGNKSFNPCCGKVIFISEEQLNKMNMYMDKETEAKRSA